MTKPPSPIVIHVPHSSTAIPPDVRDEIVLDDDELKLELLRMTDWYTDELFDIPGTVMVRYPVSRLVVDPERFVDDAQEPMSLKGMGAIYTQTSHETLLRQQPAPARRKELIERFYEPHHRELELAVDAALKAYGACLVIDGHSFPSVPSPYEERQDPDRPDLCIGTDAFHTPRDLSDRLAIQAQHCGLRTAINTPFAGALVPLKHYGTDHRVKAVMLEINRGAYMDESTGLRIASFDPLRTTIERLVVALRGRHLKATANQ